MDLKVTLCISVPSRPSEIVKLAQELSTGTLVDVVRAKTKYVSITEVERC